MCTHAALASPLAADLSSTGALLPLQALGIGKVALMFLVKGPIQHEAAWRRWFASAGGLLPINATQVGALWALGLVMAACPYGSCRFLRCSAVPWLRRRLHCRQNVVR